MNTENFLAHHGILDMMWGVRNGPPYPLDSSVSTGKRLKKNIVSRIKENRKKRKEQKESERKEREKAEKKRQAQVKRKNTIEKKKADKLEEENRIKELNARKEEIKKDILKVYKNSDLFTTKELNEINERFEAKNKIKNQALEKIKTPNQFIGAFLGYSKSAITAGRQYKDVKDLIRDIQNINKQISAAKNKSQKDNKKNNN